MTTDAVREHLRHTYGSVPVGGKGFGRPMTTCSLPDCRGMCCYDGVYVDVATEVAGRSASGFIFSNVSPRPHVGKKMRGTFRSAHDDDAKSE